MGKTKTVISGHLCQAFLLSLTGTGFFLLSLLNVVDVSWLVCCAPIGSSLDGHHTVILHKQS